MKNSVREYLLKFERASKEADSVEKNIYDHNLELDKQINDLKTANQKKIAPLMAALVEKRNERDGYGDVIKDQLSVNAQELLRELEKLAATGWFDRPRMDVLIDTQAGFLEMDELKNNISKNAKYFANALKITIRNEKSDMVRKFFYYKSFPLDENIKFSDGSTIFDNIVLVKNIDGFNTEVTNIHLSDEGLRKLMISFSPNELISDSYFIRPVELLKQSILSIIERHNPTM